MNIKTDPNKLIAFAGTVSDFSRKINTECNEISDAATRYSKMTGDSSALEVLELTRQIQRILDESDEDLLELQKRIEIHAALVEKMRSISKK